MSRKCVNKYIPDHIDQNLKWYELDAFLTYIDVLKYKDFIRNPDAQFKNAEIVNFDIIHHECRGDPLENSVKPMRPYPKRNLKVTHNEKKVIVFSFLV